MNLMECDLMPEKYKLKYLNICDNENLVYEIIDEWNILLSKNIFSSKEEKLKKLESIKEKDFNLYQIMKGDINNGSY